MPASPTRWVHYRLPRPDPAIRLFCIPHAGAGASAFVAWRDGFPDWIEVCPVQLPGRENRYGEPLPDDIRTLAAVLAEALKPLLDRPVALFGHSMGAMIAYELAAHWAAEGGPVPRHLFLSGCLPPHRMERLNPPAGEEDAELLDLLRSYNGMDPALLGAEEFVRFILPVFRQDLRLVDSFARHPDRPPLSCPVTVCSGIADPIVDPELAAEWETYAGGGFQLRLFDGDHFYLRDGRDELIGHIRLCLSQYSGK